MILNLFKRKTPAEREAAKARLENARSVLLLEMKYERLDGRPVSHRRLESLMMAAGTSKKDTIRILREIGARPSERHGAKVWTM